MKAIFKLLSCLLLAGSLPLALNAQVNKVSLNSDNPHSHWKLKPQAEVGNDNQAIFSTGYDDNGWVDAIVPGTAFTAYVNAGLEKDPNMGDNIHKVDRAKYDRSFWYRTCFRIPSDFTREHIWLNFEGVNRKADIYLNGKLLGTLDGFMQRGRFNISGIADRSNQNVLAVLVQMPRTPLANQGSPTYLSSGGWDWMPYVPGLNMGITDNVSLSNTGSLTISDPWIRTDLPANSRADLAISMEIANHSSGECQGVVEGCINPGNIRFSQNVNIGTNGTTTLKFDKKRFPQLMVDNPRLWWPNGYGEPNLYTCELTLKAGDKISDTKTVSFGIRKYTYDTLGNVLHIKINGTPVFIKGGNWGMSEYLLRCRGKEYDTKIKFHKEMNLNMVRNWLGSTTDEEFYEACDKYGIMVWDDFWLNSNPNLPYDINSFNINAVEKVKRVRNHPSIAVWCGNNEGYPEPPLDGWLRENIKTYDGNDRYYQSNSHADNLTGSGPWGNFDVRFYFTRYPDGIGGNRGWGLRTEIGTAVFTTYESFKKFMPEEHLWPRNEMWNLHYFGQQAFNGRPDFYERYINERYGKPEGIEEFCRKAQLVNLESNRAMYEGWLDRMWEDASGIMTWMSQSAYPSLVWQTYDYYYDLTGAYWGVKKACEPLHIQWNPVTDDIKIINTSGENKNGLKAEATVYNLDGTPVSRYSKTKNIDAHANSATRCFSLNFGKKKKNLALNKPVYASSSTYGQPSFINDGDNNTRWSSQSADNEWVYIDLESPRYIGGVRLKWENAYAKAYKIQISDDARIWKDIYTTTEGMGDEEDIEFIEEKARYVRMAGTERGTWWGYSLWNFEIYEGETTGEGLTDVHFIKLQLKDNAGRLISDNLYWRGNNRQDYTALNQLPEAKLKVSSSLTKKDGKAEIKAVISNPASAKSVAFAVHVQAVRTSDGERILPAIMDDNYFTLLKGENKTVRITFDESLLNGGGYKLLVTPYNNGSK